MRKLSNRHRRWLVRRAVIGMQRRRLANALRRSLARDSVILPRQRRTRAEVWIEPPSEFDLSASYQAVVGFNRRLVREFMTWRKKIIVDFTNIRTITPAAALILAAHLDMWQRIKGVRLTTRDVEKWDPEVRATLAQLGMFELLKTANAPAAGPAAEAHVKVLKFCSGEGSDGSLARELTNAMTAMVGPIEAKSALYVGLTEAMTNVAQHAYKGENAPPHYKRWWMTGTYDESARRMNVMILDLGVGIPATLTRSRHWERIRGVLLSGKGNRNDHAQMIAAAVEVGRTSTGIAGRGHGLDELRRFVEGCASGKLRIVSGQGEAAFESDRARPKLRALPAHVGGTLIEWEVFR